MKKKNEMGEGRGGEGRRLFKGKACLILRPRCLFGGGCLLEHRHLFEEIIMVNNMSCKCYPYVLKYHKCYLTKKLWLCTRPLNTDHKIGTYFYLTLQNKFLIYSLLANIKKLPFH